MGGGCGFVCGCGEERMEGVGSMFGVIVYVWKGGG